MQPQYLCHKEYRTTIPIMRILVTMICQYAAYPVVFPVLPFAAVIIWWSIRQWRFARATWSLEGSRLRNTLMGKIRALDLDKTHCISRAKVQAIHPLPVHKSRTRDPLCPDALRQRSSVSGRGISTSGETLNFLP